MSVPEVSQLPSPRRPWAAALAEPASVFTALKWGALIGAAYFLVTLLINVLFNLVLDTGNLILVAIPGCIDIFALVFGLYSAGFRVAALRNHVTPGIVSAAIMLIVAKLLSLIYIPSLATGATKATTTPTGDTVIQIVSLVLYIVVCLAIGWMGAFYGVKNNAKRLALGK